jgi:hypothetical protein
MTIYLRNTRSGKPYFVIHGGKTSISVKTAHKLFPELVGIRTAQALELLKTQPVVAVEVRKDG